MELYIKKVIKNISSSFTTENLVPQRYLKIFLIKKRRINNKHIAKKIILIVITKVFIF